jgi:hypothetical protein
MIHPSPRLPGSVLVPFEDFVFELAPDGVSGHPELLEPLREDVLAIAARSRGWYGPEPLERFRQVFKIEPLFAADGLALVWRRGRLVGLAGMVHSMPVDDGVILHLCSLGLLPEAQNRGIMPTLFGLLWDVMLELPTVREHYRAGRAYLTAITQSPYIMAFLANVSDLYPAPGVDTPAPDLVEVARRVVDRFDPHIPFDPESFILRNECEFFYRNIPYSANRTINDFCDSRLRYGDGDTFVLVGRARPQAVGRMLAAAERGHPDLFQTLRDALRTAPRLAEARVAGPAGGGGR